MKLVLRPSSSLATLALVGLPKICQILSNQHQINHRCLIGDLKISGDKKCHERFPCPD
jgi:hypothetical protein